MTLQAMKVVMDWSQQVWGEKLILLLIANYANWPVAMAEISEADLALEAGRTPRHLRNYLRRLEESGELICHRQPGRKTLFEIPQLPGEPDRREEIARQQDARKRSYDARLKRLRDERSQPEQQPAEPPHEPVGKKAAKAQAQRDWQSLKRRVTEQEQEPSS